MPRYTNVKDIAESELAGCLDIVNDPNNFEVVRDNITLRIACYIKRHVAEYLQEQITLESETATVPGYEYVINELQFEFRVAKTVGYHKMNKEYETDLLNKWATHVIDRAGVDAALDFINVLKANREKRTRAFEIKW